MSIEEWRSNGDRSIDSADSDSIGWQQSSVGNNA